MRVGGRAAAVAALVAAAASVAAAPAGAASCLQAGERVAAQNRHVQVVGGPSGDFACLRATGRRHQMGQDGDAHVDRVKVAGHHVAYTADLYDGEVDFESLSVMDARRGVEHELEFAYCASCGSFGSFVLKPNGATAWIVDQGHTYDGHDANRIVVQRCSSRCLRTAKQRPTLLDDARGIDPRSLRLRGSKVSWVRAGERRRATLR